MSRNVQRVQILFTPQYVDIPLIAREIKTGGLGG